jgi:hypothetical protein
MDPRPILGNTVHQDLNGGVSDRSSSSPPAWPGTRADAEQHAGADMRFPGEDGGKSLAQMAQRDLVATLRLLAERAQYITGATGSAIALRDGGQMVCRASAGSSAPEVGAQLQVNSGLSGESVRTKQTLRCDDAATDTRVNRESCEALGIASVVVMPLVHGEEVVGVFELFSDKAHAFDGRDITALERMGAMVFTALDQAAAGLSSGRDSGGSLPEEPAIPEEPQSAPRPSAAGIAFHMQGTVADRASNPALDETTARAEESDDILELASGISEGSPSDVVAQEEMVLTDSRDAKQAASAAPPDPVVPIQMNVPAADDLKRKETVPDATKSAVASLRRCEGCGFPVSEGRQLCLDCEKKKAREQGSAVTSPASPAGSSVEAPEVGLPGVAMPDRQELPLFLGEEPPEVSWLVSHKYMVGAIALAVAGIVALLFAR